MDEKRIFGYLDDGKKKFHLYLVVTFCLTDDRRSIEKPVKIEDSITFCESFLELLTSFSKCYFKMELGISCYYPLKLT